MGSVFGWAGSDGIRGSVPSQPAPKGSTFSDASRLDRAMANGHRPCTTLAVALSFGDEQGKGKSARDLPLSAVPAALHEEEFVWLDLDASDPVEARRILGLFGLGEELIERVLADDPATQIARYADYLHLVVTGCHQQDEQFELERVDAVIAGRFLLTVHTGPVAFLTLVQRDYRSDFDRFAKSPSFLVYELWDHLLENYLTVQGTMEARVEELQNSLRADEVDPQVFARISELGSDLLHFRKILLPARAVLTDLSTRKTLYVGEATQAFLGNMVGTLEHVLQDLLVDREILSESLNLYMSLVSHRTNLVMKRLTGVSVIFLPLTFLVGVYGMNFEHLPELRWHYGYGYFWLLVAVTVLGLLLLLRRAKML